MELRHLRYFLAVADALHFTRAADGLGVSQPTLSSQVKELEAELGLPLFDRVGRSVRLTEAGEVFRQHASRALREVEAGRGAVADLRGLRRGTLRVGVTHTFSTALIPRAVARFHLLHPAVAVRVDKTSGRAIGAGLMAGTLDLGIAYAPIEGPGIVAETLFEEEVVLIVGDGHPLAGRAEVAPIDLDQLPMALISPEFSTRRLIDETFAAARVRPEVAVEMNDIDSLLEIVRLGPGATILSRRAVIDPRGLKLIRIVAPGMTRTAAVLWNGEAYRSTAALAFAGVIREAAGDRKKRPGPP